MDDSVVRLKLLLQNELTTPFLQAKKQFNGGIDEMRSKLSDFKNAQKDSLKGLTDEIPGASRALALLSNPLAAIAAGAAAVGTGFYTAIKMANDWEEKMAHANVTAQLSRKELSGLSDTLLEIGAHSYGDLNAVPDAFNRILSAGLSVKEALTATQPTLKAAKAGWADIETTAAAGVGVMNASGENINTVYDILFATVNKGNAEFKDIAQYLPKIVPTARQAGLALYETAGSWAYLTAQGMNSEHATRLMENGLKVMTQLDKVHAFRKMGVEIFDLHTGKIKPFISIIDQLVKKTKGLTDLGRMRYFNKLGMDVEASSFFAVATQNANKLRETIDFTRDSQGQLNQAFENAKTPLDSWKEAINGIKVESIKLGEALLPMLTKIGNKVADIVGKIPGMLRSLDENKVFSGNEGQKKGKDYVDSSIIGQFGKSIKTQSDLDAALGNAIKKANEMRDAKDNAARREANTSIPFGSSAWLEANLNKGLSTATFGTVKKPLGLRSADEIKAESTGFGAQYFGGMRDAIIQGIQSAPSEFLKWQREQKAGGGKPPKDPNGNQWDTEKNKKLKDTTDHVAGTAKQIHNITVNVDAFNKGGINTQNTSLQKMDANQIESWFTQSMLRMIRNLEMQYS